MPRNSTPGHIPQIFENRHSNKTLAQISRTNGVHPSQGSRSLWSRLTYCGMEGPAKVGTGHRGGNGDTRHCLLKDAGTPPPLHSMKSWYMPSLHAQSSVNSKDTMFSKRSQTEKTQSDFIFLEYPKQVNKLKVAGSRLELTGTRVGVKLGTLIGGY